MKILIFDDDEDILSICTFIFEDAGWQVFAYTDCRDIVARTIAYSPDVILMDNWIPEEGGIIATQALKSDSDLKNIPVIYFSANSNIQYLAAKAGAEFCIPKPFDLDGLKTAVIIAAKL